MARRRQMYLEGYKDGIAELAEAARSNVVLLRRITYQRLLNSIRQGSEVNCEWMHSVITWCDSMERFLDESAIDPSRLHDDF